MLDGQSWRKQLAEDWGIKTLDSFSPSLQAALWTTRCSKTKTVPCGTPEQLYVSKSNLYFYRFARQANVRFGIISDKYGVHFDDEPLPYYDIHPGELSREDKQALARLVRDKVNARGYREVVFYNASPLMSVPYLQILSLSELAVYFTTRLPHAWR